MYELTFSVEKCNEDLLKYMYNQLNYHVKKVGGVCQYLQQSKRSSFALACNDLYAASIKEESQNCLADTLTLGYKNLYVRQRLNIDCDSFYVNTLVNTMCVFDNKFDKHFVKKSLDFHQQVCIDGFYNFRMQHLKNKWDELVSIVQNNSALLRDDYLIKEFLCYLIDFLPSTEKSLSIVIDNNVFKLFDSKGKLLSPINMVCPSTLEEIVAINAICIHPQCINLYCDEQSLQSGFLELLTYLFDVKVVQNS